MNRKDTILVAVLINMALLVILFVSAVKPAASIESAHPKKGDSPHVVAKIQGIEEKKNVIDQVDQVLSKYVENESKTELPLIAVKEVVEVPSFEQLSENSEESDSKRHYKEVIVKQGDVLEKIARNHHTTVDEVMRINKMSSTRLQIGQILYIPTYTSNDIVAVASNVIEGSGKYYVVKNGDNPWTIAVKNGIKVEELLRLNGLNEEKAKKIKPGDRLRIK